MPPGKRKSSKGREGSADAASDGAMAPPAVGGSSVRRAESELSGSDMDEGKRFKPGSPLVERAGDTAGILSDTSSAGGSRQSRSRIKKSTVVIERMEMPAGAGNTTSRMQKVAGELTKVVVEAVVQNDDKLKILNLARRYEELIVGLLAENERLKGRLDEVRKGPVTPAAAACAPVVAAGAKLSAVGAAPVRPVPQAIETWSVVVKGKSGSSSKEVVEKVVGEVAPDLGVRVHGIRPMKDGGAVIRTRSLAERQKIVANKKFEEVGLEVSVVEKLGPRIMVQKVDMLVSPEEFMEDLYSMNLGEMMSKEVFRKSVRMISPLWKQKEGITNVLLECTERVAEYLKATGVYVKWFRFLVRVQDAVAACHRCYSFDHRVKDCKMKVDICRLCGQGGHLASGCVNPVHCRNCALRRCAADHPMLSMQCPVYAAMVARANARH